MSSRDTFLRIRDQELCAIDEDVIRKILDGESDLTKPIPAAPVREAMDEIMAAYERNHGAAYERVSRVSETGFDRMVSCFLPGGEWKMPQPEALWNNVMDQVYHRGQLTVCLRQAGAKVPSIYGPSGGEPMAVARN